jgi:hypothetical protein
MALISIRPTSNVKAVVLCDRNLESCLMAGTGINKNKITLVGIVDGRKGHNFSGFRLSPRYQSLQSEVEIKCQISDLRPTAGSGPTEKS